MIDGQNVFDKPVKNDTRSYDNIRMLQLVNEMTTQLVVCQIIPMPKNIKR